MDNKKNLSKIALSALILAAAAIPGTGSTTINASEAQGTFLAANCGSCGAKKNNPADNGNNGRMYRYEPNANPYQNAPQYSNQPPRDNPNMNGPRTDIENENMPRAGSIQDWSNKQVTENSENTSPNSNHLNLGGWSRSSTTGQFIYTSNTETDEAAPPAGNENNKMENEANRQIENPNSKNAPVYSTNSNGWNYTEQVADNRPGNWGPGNQPGSSIPGGGRLNSYAGYQEAYNNSYNSNRSDVMSPTYLDNPRGTGNESFRNNGFNTNLNREYNTVSDYDYSRSTVNAVTSSGTLSEAQLLGALTPQVRSIYLSLDPEGKTLAIQLASQDSYRDKNLAVKEAQRRIAERYGLMNR